MGLRDIESTLPPGFRFHPSDEELVCHYLYRKVANVKIYEGTMVEVDLHTREPWELPEAAKLGDNEWYFFSFRDRKYATGSRTNRATKSGYWKATGKDRIIYNPKTRGVVGMRKTLVFYSGRAPNGMKTGWVMHEFRVENPHTPPKEDWVLCRVTHKRKGDAASSSSRMDISSPMIMADQSLLDECLETMWGQNEARNAHNTYDSNSQELHYNFFDFTTELSATSMMGIDTGMGLKDIDDYGFLLDSNLLDDVGVEDYD